MDGERSLHAHCVFILGVSGTERLVHQRDNGKVAAALRHFIDDLASEKFASVLGRQHARFDHLLVLLACEAVRSGARIRKRRLFGNRLLMLLLRRWGRFRLWGHSGAVGKDVGTFGIW